jgi:hypothetical protein
MLVLKYLLMILGVALFGSAGALVVYDVYISEQLRRLVARKTSTETATGTGTTARRPFRPVRSRFAQRLANVGMLAILLALSRVMMPDGSAGARPSQIWTATLYPGVH